MGAYRRHVELTDEELERLEAVMYLRPCAWVVSATGVSWSTAVSQARRCRASLTPSTTPIAALDGTSLTTQGSKKPHFAAYRRAWRAQLFAIAAMTDFGPWAESLSAVPASKSEEDT